MSPLLQAFFYPASYGRIQLTGLLYGAAVDLGQNIIDFPEEKGGSADQKLAVPFLPGMDEIEVEEARIMLRAAPKDLEIEDYKVTANGNIGVYLSLIIPARLKKVEIRYTPPTSAHPAKVMRLVVRTATPSGAGFGEGVPLFAYPDFGKAGPMYEPVLGGMTVTDLGSDRRLLRLPSVLGRAWLIQVATGDKPTELAPLQVKPIVNHVTLDAVPRNLSVALVTGGNEVTLWNNPEALLPDGADQEVSFTPLAQRHLTAALKSASESELTLSVPIRFRSDSGGAIAITATSLKSEYVVRPLGQEPVTLRLGGDLIPLVLNAPAALTPKRSSMRLTAKLVGRELNAASPEPFTTSPATGLRVGLARSAATAVEVAPSAGETAGSVLAAASARVYLSAPTAAEVVMEIHGDVAESPGPIVAPPIVRQLEAGFSGWLEFELAKPLTVVSGQAPLWLSLRTNKGEVFWFASPGGPAKSRISTDRGETWSPPDSVLTPSGRLLAQLFHHTKDPLPAPVVRLQNGSIIMKTNLFTNPEKKSDREYVIENAALPDEVHSLLAARTGQGRVSTELLLFTTSVVDLTLENLAIKYDPFQGLERATTLVPGET
jgi:hypothetical protein